MHNLFPKKAAKAWKGFFRDLQSLKGKASTWDIFAVDFLQGHINRADSVMIDLATSGYKITQRPAASTTRCLNKKAGKEKNKKHPSMKVVHECTLFRGWEDSVKPIK